MLTAVVIATVIAIATAAPASDGGSPKLQEVGSTGIARHILAEIPSPPPSPCEDSESANEDTASLAFVLQIALTAIAMLIGYEYAAH